MKKENLIEEIEIELELLEKVVAETALLKNKTVEVEPDVMIKAAAGTYLMNFYNGIENLLKRIHKLENVTMPKGEDWHTELFKRFCNPPFQNLPQLFDVELELKLVHYKKFRHLFIHGYGFQLEWKLMKEGVDNMGSVFNNIRTNVISFLETIR